jgi:hypothetical protein
VLAVLEAKLYFVAGEQLGRLFDGMAGDEIVAFSLLVRLDQSLHFFTKIGVRATLLLHVRSASRVVEGDCRFEYATYLLPAFRVQFGALPVSWRWSHARAMFQSRMTVFSEIFNTPAISSLFNPPKYLSSTT